MLFNLLIDAPIHSERISEFEHCLYKNLKNQYIKHIYFFTQSKEHNEDVYREKITIKFKKERMKFIDLFKFSNENNLQETIVSNGDIYFDETLNKFQTKHFNKNEFYHLTRKETFYNDMECNFFHHTLGAGDAWIFKTPVQEFGDFEIGTLLCCDQVILYLAKSLGYNLINPCLSINAWHVHNKEFRKPFDSERWNKDQQFIKDKYNLSIPPYIMEPFSRLK